MSSLVIALGAATVYLTAKTVQAWREARIKPVDVYYYEMCDTSDPEFVNYHTIIAGDTVVTGEYKDEARAALDRQLAKRRLRRADHPAWH